MHPIWPRIIFVLSLFTDPLNGVGQNTNVKLDSLQVILNQTRSDTARVSLLISMSREAMKSLDYDKAKNFVDEAISIAKKTKDRTAIYNAQKALGGYYHDKARNFQRQAMYPDAINTYLMAVRVREQINDKVGLGRSYGNMGLAYTQMSNFNEALKYDIISLKYFSDANDQLGIAGANNSIGVDYMNLANYNEALQYYRKAIKIYSDLGKKEWLVGRYFNLGFMYEDMKNYPEALKYHEIALNIANELNDKGSIAPALHNYGSVFYLQAKDVAEPEKRKTLLMKSLDYQVRSLKTYQEGGIDYGLSTIYLFTGKIYFELGDYLKSRENAEKALELAKQDDHTYDQKESLILLSKLDSTSGNWKEALNNYKSFVHFKDSMSSEENTRNLLKAQIQYNFNKKEDSLRYLQQITDERLKQQTLHSLQQEQRLLLQKQDFEILNKESELQRLQSENDKSALIIQKNLTDKKHEQLQILGKESALQNLELKKQKITKNFFIGGLLLFALLSFFVYRNHHTRQKLKLQTLRNKIASDLHDDVGSTLSSISIFSQMAQQQSKDVIPLLETIEESSRKMLDAMGDIVWTIKPENDQFEKILLRMKSFAFELLGAKNIEFKFDMDDDVAGMKLPMEVRKNLYLIFKEATNNMVKYSNASRAEFLIKRDRNNLMMMIKDYGKGFDVSIPKSGNGLVNMKKRADEIGALFKIKSLPGTGTTIQLSVSV